MKLFTDENTPTPRRTNPPEPPPCAPTPDDEAEALLIQNHVAHIAATQPPEEL